MPKMKYRTRAARDKYVKGDPGMRQRRFETSNSVACVDHEDLKFLPGEPQFKFEKIKVSDHSSNGMHFENLSL